MVSLYSREILLVKDNYIALSTMTSISDIQATNGRFGEVWPIFNIKSIGGEKNIVTIYGDNTCSYGHVLTGEDKRDYRSRIYKEHEQQLDSVRQQVLSYWNQYLEEKKDETTL